MDGVKWVRINSVMCPDLFFLLRFSERDYFLFPVSGFQCVLRGS